MSLHKLSAAVRHLLVLSLLLLSTPLAVIAQSFVDVDPVTFWRFRVSNQNKGYLMTANFSEGANAGFAYDPWPFAFSPDYVEIIPSPGPGYTPQPGQHILALHRWRVTESGRSYYYYSLWYSQHGSNYFYDGIAGYAFHPSFTGESTGTFMPTHELYIYYSQRYGYWYSLHRPENWHHDTTLGQFPDGNVFNTSYRYHGVTAKLLTKAVCENPTGVAQGSCPVFRFDAPPPPPTCDPYQEQACYENGGSWDSMNCTCNYMPPPDPCYPGMICNQVAPTQSPEPPPSDRDAPPTPPLN